MKSKAVLSQTEVATILAAARAEAQANGWAVTIVVADDGGHPLALERLDGCAPIASYIATEKARSSALGRRETKGYEDMVNNGCTASSPRRWSARWRVACRWWSTATSSVRSAYPV